MADVGAEARLERSHDVERLITFVDAIVAIAITLLVLPLTELAGHLDSHDPVWRLIRTHGDLFGSFLLSFAVIARFWFSQHHVVRQALHVRQDFAFWLIVWAFAIVFLPFPTELLSADGSQAATKIFYLGTLTLNCVSLAMIAASVRRQRSAAGLGGRHPRVAPSVLNAGACALALVLSLAFPVLSYWPLFLLYAADRVDRRLQRREERADRERSQPGSA